MESLSSLPTPYASGTAQAQPHKQQIAIYSAENGKTAPVLVIPLQNRESSGKRMAEAARLVAVRVWRFTN